MLGVLPKRMAFPGLALSVSWYCVCNEVIFPGIVQTLC